MQEITMNDDITAARKDASWIGLSVGEYKIDSILGEGLFSRVYKGTSQSGSSKVFKVAKDSSATSTTLNTVKFDTQALRQITGGFLRMRPDAEWLVAQEAERLENNAHPNLVKVDAFSKSPVPYFQMEHIEGSTLRQLMQSGPVPIKIFLEIARSMNQLLRDTKFGYHGDLKPENIIVTKEGAIKFIDPGYFGDLKDLNGRTSNTSITTPIYYPFLQPDDVLAFGLILWEAAFGEQPLSWSGGVAVPPASDAAKMPAPPGNYISSEEIDCDHVGEDLLAYVRGFEMCGNYFLSPILALRDPLTRRPEMPAEVRAFLLKCLRLRAGKKMNLDTGYQSMGQIAGALIALSERGIEHF